MDIDLPDVDGVTATHRSTAELPETTVAVLAAYDATDWLPPGWLRGTSFAAPAQR